MQAACHVAACSESLTSGCRLVRARMQQQANDNCANINAVTGSPSKMFASTIFAFVPEEAIMQLRIAAANFRLHRGVALFGSSERYLREEG